MQERSQKSTEQWPALAVYASLREAQLRNLYAPEGGVFIAESPKVIGRALDAGCVPESFLMDRGQILGECREVLSRCPDVPLYTGEQELLTKITGFVLTRGALCCMRRPALPRPEELLCGARRVAVLEQVVNPANVGSIFRNAAALGMDAVLLSPGCADPLCRRAERTSMGTVFQVPWTILEGDWPGEGMALLRRQGFFSVAMALLPDTLDIRDERLRRQERLAVLLGSEGNGLREETIELCDGTVCIPMRHGVDSLNVAAASAIAFWQLGRG